MFQSKERAKNLEQKLNYYLLKANQSVNSFMSITQQEYQIELEHRNNRIKLLIIRCPQDVIYESRWSSKKRMARTLKTVAGMFSP